MRVTITRTTPGNEELIEECVRFTTFVAMVAAVLGFVLGVASAIAWFDIDVTGADAVGEGE